MDCKTPRGTSEIFVKHDLEYSLREDLLLNLDNCEDVWIEIKLKKCNLSLPLSTGTLS